jgi:hypothetical protein
VTGMLMGMQGGFTEFCCFLRLWDSYCTAKHYIEYGWEPRETSWEKTSVQHITLVNPMKVFLLPLHIKLGLIKCLMDAMAKIN